MLSWPRALNGWGRRLVGGPRVALRVRECETHFPTRRGLLGRVIHPPLEG